MEVSQIRVEVAYALPHKQFLKVMMLSEGSTAIDAIHASGVLEENTNIDLSIQKIGIYSRVVELDTVLRDRDRVEIYRPLLIDPKEVRRQRAKKNEK